jgi:hypothetical protein
MVNPRIAALLRGPRPEREWHSGELETAMELAVRPGLVRRALARRLPPTWVDVKRALAAGRTAFRKMNPKGRGYFGWPAAALRPSGSCRRAGLVQRRLACFPPSWRRAGETDRRTFSRTSFPRLDTRCSQSASVFKVRKRLAGVA